MYPNTEGKVSWQENINQLRTQAAKSQAIVEFLNCNSHPTSQKSPCVSHPLTTLTFKVVTEKFVQKIFAEFAENLDKTTLHPPLTNLLEGNSK